MHEKAKPIFNPNAASSPDSGIFGLLDTEDSSNLILIPVPWEATTSYRGGTSRGPQAILQASRQVDLYDLDLFRPYEGGVFLLPESPEIQNWNKMALAQRSFPEQVNGLSMQLNEFVYQQTRKILDSNKFVGIIGGEHSVPFGALQAIADKQVEWGILHFDAHSDTRVAFEGYTHSHASIFYNILTQIPSVTRVVQVGIRDFCEEEFEFCRAQKKRVNIFYDRDLASKKFHGILWRETTQEILNFLPENVWISFDIDGLDPKLCPNTGTPVPGGLEFNEACFVIAGLVRSGRKIIGFDLCEVAPDLKSNHEWDANVGARLLYQLIAWLFKSQRGASHQ
jgi:agmatinase